MDPFIQIPGYQEQQLILQHLRKEILKLTEVSPTWHSTITKNKIALSSIKITVNTEDAFEVVMKSDRNYQNISIGEDLPEQLQLDVIQKFSSSIGSLEVYGRMKSAVTPYQQARRRILSLLYSDSFNPVTYSILTKITSLCCNDISLNLFEVLSSLIGYQLRTLSIVGVEVAGEAVAAFLKRLPKLNVLAVSDLGFMEFSDDVQLKLTRLNLRAVNNDQDRMIFNDDFKKTNFWKFQAASLKTVEFSHQKPSQSESSSSVFPESLRISTVKGFFKVLEVRNSPGIEGFIELDGFSSRLQEVISKMSELESFSFEAAMGKIIYRKINETDMNSSVEKIFYQFY